MNRLLLSLTLFMHFAASAQRITNVGDTVSPINHFYSFTETGPLINGYAKVQNGQKFSFINSSGKQISDLQFDDARNFSNKLAAVNKDGKWGFIDQKGIVVIPCNYEIVFDFTNSVTVGYEQKRWSLINASGTLLKYLSIDKCYGFVDGIAKVEWKGRTGVMDINGLIQFSAGSNVKVQPRQVPTNNSTFQCPENIDFEDGNFSNWKCFTGTTDSVNSTNVITVAPSNVISNRHRIITRSNPAAFDPYGLFELNPPDGSSAAVKLGNTRIGAEAERIQYTIRIPANDSNFSIKYDYAVVFQDPDHSAWVQPRFTAKLFDSAANTYIECASFEYIATSNLPGFAVSPVDNSVIYKPWASAYISLRDFAGKTLYLEFTTADCVKKGHWGYAYVDVESVCGNELTTNFQCATNTATITAPGGFQTYNWWNNDYSVLLGTGSELNLSPAPTTATNIWLQLDPFTAFGCRDTLPVIISGPFVPEIVQPSSMEFCAGTSVSIPSFSSSMSGAVIRWTNDNPSIGLPASGTGNIPAFTSSNNTGATNIATITVTGNANNCDGRSKIFTITILPTPAIDDMINQEVCNGQPTTPVILNSVSAATGAANYSWINSNPSIGLPASGSGNILSFVATNYGNVPVTASIIVSMNNNGCTAIPEVFNIIVNSTPTANTPGNQNICRGSNSASIIFTGAIPNTKYNWTADQTGIGIPSSGIDSITSFTAINNTTSIQTANVIVKPVLAGCEGPVVSFRMQVAAVPDVNQPINYSICNGSNVVNIVFAGTLPGTEFHWTNNQPSIGLAAAGIGTIPSFITTNVSSTNTTATITVTPILNGCYGTPKTFTIKVLATPTVVQPLNLFQCNGESTRTIVFAGPTPATVFNWVNNLPSIGLPTAGTGNIQTFVTNNASNTPVVSTITVTPMNDGCAGTPKIFTITIDPSPVILQPLDVVVCSGNTVAATTFTSNLANATFSWINNSTAIGLQSNGTGTIPSFIATNNTLFPITAIIAVTATANSCGSIVKIFTITVNPGVELVEPADQSVCNGKATQAVQLVSTVGGNDFRWENDKPAIGLPINGTGTIPVFNATNATGEPIIARIKVFATNGCAGMLDSFLIKVNPSPVIQANDNLNICLGNTAPLSATGGVSYSWSPATGLSCTTCPNPNATITDAFSYLVTGTDNAGCKGQDSVFLNVRKPFEMLLPPNDTICSGRSVNLAASNATTYQWSPSEGLSSSTIANPIASPIATTRYRVIGKDQFNCFSDTGYITIAIAPKPTVQIGTNQTASIGSTVTLNPVVENGPVVRYTWTPANDLSCSDCPSPIATIRNNIVYSLTVENRFGCIAGDTIMINGLCQKAQVFIPNAFTPDGDGLNDILMIRGSGVQVKSFRVFNRWGEVIFQKLNFTPNDPRNGWDGKIKGVPASPDVYIYLAAVSCDNGSVYTYKGNTTILK